MTSLLDEEIEEDELFWNQDALKEVTFMRKPRSFSACGNIGVIFSECVWSAFCFLDFK